MLFALTFEDQSFRYGPTTVAYADVVAAGVGVSRTKYAVRRSLLVSHRAPGDPKPKLLRVIDVDPSVAGEMQRRLAGRWQGEAPLLTMRKHLGFSNSRTFVIVAVLVVIALAISAGLIAMGGH